MTPVPWVNVIANPDFDGLVSESGSATTWSENAHEFRLTPWCNDPVSYPITKAFYIRKGASGRFWSLTVLSTRVAGAYTTRHRFGYSVFEHAQDGIDSELRVSVTIDSPIKFSVVRLRNRSDWPRRLSVTGYLEWVLGDQLAKTQIHGVTARHLPATPPIPAALTQSHLPGRKVFYPSSSALGLRYQLPGVMAPVHAALPLARVHLLCAAASHRPLRQASSTTASKPTVTPSHWSMTVRSTRSSRTLPTVVDSHNMQRRKSCKWE